MPADQGTHVVLGAGGGTGTAIVDELLRRGLPVRAVTRRPESVGEGVEHVVADLNDPAAARDALSGAAVVYHAASPPYHTWTTTFPALNDSVVAATSAAGARLVFADNLYMYGPGSGVMTEDTPIRATDKKGVLRASMAEKLLLAHTAGELEVVIGRSPDYFGPGGTNSALGENTFGAALAGKTVRWVGSPDVPHSVAYLPDMARAFVTLGLSPEAAGKVWHLPTCGAPTGREFVAAIAAASGRDVAISGTPRWLLQLVGLVNRAAREMTVIYYQWSEPFVSSDAAYQEAFGPDPATPLAEAVAATAAWFEARASG
ncbi:MAG: NAD-dependent epimerase/dehydratase family protein [Candidatus Limnocylindrales bacterium]